MKLMFFLLSPKGKKKLLCNYKGGKEIPDLRFY